LNDEKKNLFFFNFIDKNPTTNEEREQATKDKQNENLFSTRWRRKKKGYRRGGNATRVRSGCGPTCY
jgi:hypothetical protein